MADQAFTGRHALVTAAAQGIGRAIAIGLAAGGCRLTLIDIEGDPLDVTAQQLREAGAEIDTLRIDCTDADAVATALDGQGPFDILINGIGSSARERSSLFDESKPEVWDFVHDVTLKSAMLCSRAVLPMMRARRYGRIVNISSDAALRPTSKMAEYAAAKAGVIGFTRAIASEFGAHGITCNAIAPGLIRTRALDAIPSSTLETAQREIPVGRLGIPEDVAFAALFLADERSGFVTGQTIAVNGGRSYL